MRSAEVTLEAYKMALEEEAFIKGQIIVADTDQDRANLKLDLVAAREDRKRQKAALIEILDGAKQLAEAL